MVTLTKRIILLTLGWFFILLGIAGLFLPILQGLLFIFVGLILLSKESKKAKEILHHFKERHPRPFKLITDLRQRIKTKLQNLITW